MNIPRKIRDILAGAMLVAAIILFFVALAPYSRHDDGTREAAQIAKVLNKKIARLEACMTGAISADRGSWLDIAGLPRDMVIYRYCADTLQSWVHEFPISNDNLQVRPSQPFLVNPTVAFESPLANLGDELSYVNMGPSWYLVKSITDGDCRVIGGIEVVNSSHDDERRGPKDGHLHIPNGYKLRPLSDDCGVTVELEGRPMFKVLRTSIDIPRQTDATLLWISFFMFISSAIIFLSTKRSLKRLWITMCSLAAVMILFYFAGKTVTDQFTMFSPRLYAGSGLLYSLGAVLIINMAILVFCECLFLTRNSICATVIRSKKACAATLGITLLLISGIFCYAFISLKNIIVNSGISLELYKLATVGSYSIAVYSSYLTMLLSVPLLIQSISPLIVHITGRKYDAFSAAGKTIFSVAIAAFLVVTSAVLGFRKEQSRMEVLAYRLAFDRDISLELYLRSIESDIADDMVVSALSVFNNTEVAIQNRIAINYFARNEMNYSLSVYVFNSNNSHTRMAVSQYNSLLKGGEPIADNSRFLYVKRDNGRSYYLGVFLYMVEGNDISRVVLKFEPRDTGSNRGYAGILGLQPPGMVSIPEGFSYARYEVDDLKDNRGNFPYPTKLDAQEHMDIYHNGVTHQHESGYLHYITIVGQDECVLLSRQTIQASSYIEMCIFLALIEFMLLSLATLHRKNKKPFAKGYYRTRITAVLLVSLTCTLLVTAVVSVLFVYNRNDANMKTAMSEKISSITSMIEAETTNISRSQDMDRDRMMRMIKRVSDDTDSDITLYSSNGRVMMSTTPFMFERMMLGGRLDGEAYGEIIYGHRRYCVLHDRLGPNSFYTLYAPIFGADGNIVGIVSSPYNEESYNIRRDAVTHSVTIISLFLIFLLVALFTVSAVVDRMFQPLSEMSHNMNKGGLNTLEYIEYDRDDEISAIVQAYNRMVNELAESSRKLAQAERDKAWSEMARQVAHEIKNPLTPMKLQLQRVMRLKEKNDPKWQERFDDMSQVLLNHIDILTETANEFSTFAKLYTEEPTEIRLDRLIHDELSMFDNKENVRFDFLGLEDVTVMGPKPQLTRVFVNLINNSVQAIGDAPDGRIMVSLRHSATMEGFYDIVFEDNGPGVAEENVKMLFTPNFTTKTGGSGLGLAISRSILEKCGATISYSRSFALGGAAFTIRYPKMQG